MPEMLERITYMPGHEPIVTRDYEPTLADYQRMSRALELGHIARESGNTPVGTVLVHEVTGTAWEASNTEFSEQDLKGHPEEKAYDQAKAVVGRDLSQCNMYTVAEPCVGCSYWIDKGRIGTLFIGALREELTFFRDREVNMNRIFGESRRSLTVVRGLMAIEAKELLRPENNIHSKF